MANYNIREVTKEKIFRRKKIENDYYFYLTDVLTYYGYNKFWFRDHKKDIITNNKSDRCKVVLRNCGSIGMNHKGLFINWHLLLRLITIFAYQKITGRNKIEEAKFLSKEFKEIKNVDLNSFIEYCGDNIKNNEDVYHYIRSWVMVRTDDVKKEVVEDQWFNEEVEKDVVEEVVEAESNVVEIKKYRPNPPRKLTNQKVQQC